MVNVLYRSPVILPSLFLSRATSHGGDGSLHMTYDHAEEATAEVHAVEKGAV